MKKPNAPTEPDPGDPLRNIDWQAQHLKEKRRIHDECDQIGPDAIRVKLVRGTWTGFQAKIGEEWLIYYRSKYDRWTRIWSVVGVVAAVLAAIFGAVAIL